MLKKRKRAVIIYLVLLLSVIAVFVYGVLKTRAYNRTIHKETYAGEALFTAENVKTKSVCVNAVPRTGTWTKLYDFNNEGLTEHNVQAYTYDFTVSNNTKDEISDYSYRLNFESDTFLMSAWNGSLEIHQKTAEGELVATIPDLREFNSEDYELKTINVDGEKLIQMKPGDYLIYLPSTSMNAMEMPIEPYEGITSGIILYVMIGESFETTSMELEYKFHRLLYREPLFWVSVVGLVVWMIALIIFMITSAQIKKYNERHERDNEIIKESIETFTGFIDAKDPYTNGHSKRVAEYTKLIAQEMGYEGEELDRVYYVALLHDCGKIGVPDNILGKPGRLDDDEFQIIKSHTIRGGEILSSFKSLKNVGEGALYHHERYDGKGYPEGKSGEDIPFIARMICVADSFDAMNSNRVYRKKLTKELIIEEIKKNKGKQFDPKVADVMLRLIKEGKIVIDE